MKNKKKSPMTSFGSFEELAQNLEGFDYEKAKANKELAEYKSTFNSKEEYEQLKSKVRKINEARTNYFDWKNRTEYLNGIHSMDALKIKVEQTFAKYENKIVFSPKESNEHSCACFFNSLDRPEHFKDIQNEVKVGLIAAEQELKRVKQEANITEYSNAIRIIKIVEKTSVDDVIQDCDSYAWMANTKEEYRYARIASKLNDFFYRQYTEYNKITPNYENLLNWLDSRKRIYEN